MELVHGIPITDYCDAHRLTPRERLELFLPVCHAIQHAHQKGIIHRDIKPSNILVTMYDDRPVPKVIDFGVSKAIEQRLTEKTVYTQFGTLVGTFEYMSPEQAELNAFGVDTRSDVYALGVLLYELLKGFDAAGAASAAGGGLRGHRAPDQGGGAAAAEHAPEQIRGGTDRHLATAWQRAGAINGAGARRAGLDRDALLGEGPHATIRDGQRPGPGRGALFAR
jgi:hypothetical protein